MMKRHSILSIQTLEGRDVPATFNAVLGDGHTDLSFDYRNSAWRVAFHDTQSNIFHADDKAIAFASSATKITQPIDPTFAFLGAGAGKPVYVLPQQQVAGQLFLGISTLDTDPADIGQYQEDDPRINSTDDWMRLRLVEVEGPGRFSLYQTDAKGAPTVWMSNTVSIDDNDEVFVAAGKDVHYNWAFSQPGNYKISLQASTYLGDNQTNFVESEIYEFLFSISPPAPVNTVPSAQVADFANGGLVFTAANNNTISVAAPTLELTPIQMTLFVTQGTLRLGSTTGLTFDQFSGNGAQKVIFSGRATDVNNALQSLIYSPITNATATLTITSSDLGETRPTALGAQEDTDFVTISVIGQPLAPPTVPPGPGTIPPAPIRNTPDGLPVLPPSPPTSFPSFTNDHLLVTASGPGVPSVVRVFDAATGMERFSFAPYASSFTGGVRVASGDVNGDGFSDIVVAAGPGGGPHVQVFDGQTGQVIMSFFAYASTFTGGIWVALADITGDGRADIITGAGEGGGPHVQVFEAITGRSVNSWFAYNPGVRNGVTVAAGDVNGDGLVDVVTGPGVGGAPHIRVWNPLTGTEVRGFFAFDAADRFGYVVAVADFDGDGFDDIAVGPQTGNSLVRVFRGSDGRILSRYTPFDVGTQTGVRLGVTDFNANGQPDLAIGAGFGAAPRVQVYDGSRRGGAEVESNIFFSDTPLTDFFAYDPTLIGGVFVAGS